MTRLPEGAGVEGTFEPRVKTDGQLVEKGKKMTKEGVLVNYSGPGIESVLSTKKL